MPKITNHVYKGYCVSVTYSTKRTAFKITLPQDLRMYGESVESASEKGATREFDILVERYLKEGATREKIILINAASENVNDDFYRAKGESAGLKIQWVILEKIVVDGEPVYRRGEMFGDTMHYQKFHNFNNHYRVIAWTQEREDFLKSTTNTLQEITSKVLSFFDQKKLESRIDNGSARMLLSAQSGPAIP